MLQCVQEFTITISIFLFVQISWIRMLDLSFKLWLFHLAKLVDMGQWQVGKFLF